MMEFKMGEFKFVFKCLLFSSFVIFVSQYKWNDETLEAKAEYAFVKSETAEKLREVAAGGVKLIRTTTETVVEYVKNKVTHAEGGVQHESSRSY